jgi:porphobilinogen deaminase
MFEVRKDGKKIKNALTQLGDKYTIRTIDLERCIYLKLETGYYFEVSGLNNAKRSFNVSLYIWDDTIRKIVEKVHDITSVDMLRDCLEAAEEKYSKPRNSIEQLTKSV